MKPFLRWAGSKRQLVNEIRKFWCSEYNRYIEPFAGSACLFFKIEPDCALIGDINQELIHVFRMIKNKPSIVIEALKRIPVSKETYYRVRGIDPTELTDAERAASFLYLNRYCFNGLYRTNKLGKFNVPYGDNKGNNRIDYDTIQLASEKLQNAQLFCCDFGYLLSMAQPNDFVYLDPPYWIESNTIFNEYNAKSFSSQDLDRLANYLTHLDGIGAKFVVSYANCDKVYQMLKKWQIAHVTTRRNIAGFTSNRKTASELLISNILREEKNGSINI